MDQGLIPLTDEQAKAVQEMAKAWGITLETAQKVGGFLRQIVGSVPDDFIGLAIGDWLKAKRFENMIRLSVKVQEKLKARNVQNPQPISLVLAKPLLEAAADESREELQDLWAKLIANAMDPARANNVRQEYIDTIKKFHPTDAKILETLYEVTGELKPSVEAYLSDRLGRSTDAVSVSLESLARAGCVAKNPVGAYIVVAFGREFMKAAAS